MSEDFQRLKGELTEFCRQVREKDELAAGFDRLVDAQRLREIVDALRENFPKDATPGDEYTMHFAYAQMSPDARTEKDMADWRKHIKKFINVCPAEPKLAGHVAHAVKHLPEACATTGEAFNYGLRALRLLPKKTPIFESCEKEVQKMALSDFHTLLDKANGETNYQKQIKAYDRALARLTDIPPGSRYKYMYECLHAMAPVYERTDWGKVEFPHKRRLVSNRIFKSLPPEMQTIIRNRKNERDWWLR